MLRNKIEANKSRPTVYHMLEKIKRFT